MGLYKRNIHTLIVIVVTMASGGSVRANDSSALQIQSANEPATESDNELVNESDNELINESDNEPVNILASDEVIETIEVIAEVPSTGDVIHDEFTGSYRRIHSEELQRRDITVSDILSHESGVQSRQAGGFGTFSSISIRAGSAAQTGVYLDGVLLNSGSNAVVDVSMLDLLSVDSVDIYRGATPMQLGFGSIGGAVNFNSASALGAKPSTTLSVGFGSFSTQRAQLLHRSELGRFDVLGAFSLQQSENDYSFIDGNGTPLNANDDERELRNNAQVRKLSGMARAGFRWTSNSRSDVVLHATGRELGVPEWRNAVNNEADFASDNWRLHFNHRIDSIGDWNSRHSVYLHNDDDLFDDKLSQIGLGAQLTESNASTSGFLTYWEHVGPRRTSSVSVELRQESEDASDLLAADFNYRVERRTTNVAAQSTRYAMAERLVLTTALSFQSHQDQYDRITRLNQSSRNASVFSPSLGLRFDSSAQLSLRANVGRYYREPSFGELFGSRGLIRGSNDLEAEEGINADVGMSWKPNAKLAIESAVFSSWRDELIATVYDARGIGRSVNIGKAQILGIEFGANWQISPRFSLRANLTSQEAKSMQAFKAFNDKQLPGEAKHSAFMRLQYSHKKLRAFIETDGAWERFYDQANVLPAEDRWLQNLGVDWKQSRWTLSAALSNITDQNVEDFNGFPRHGRSFTFSVTTRL